MSRRRLLALAASGTAVSALATTFPGTVSGLGGSRRAAAVAPSAPADDFVAPNGLRIRRRRAWAGDSRPARAPMADETVRFLLVHHTAGPNGADPVTAMQGIYGFHTGPDKGWPDVAYNFFIDHTGVVWEAREGSLDRPVEASATGGNQGFSHLVCLLGDFTSVLPTPEALDSLNLCLAWLADRFGLDTSPGATTTFVSDGSNKWPAGAEVTANIVSGHRDMSATACPGDTFYPYLVERVQGEVHAMRTGAPADPAPPDSTPASTTGPSTDTTDGSAPGVEDDGGSSAGVPDGPPPSTSTIPPPTTSTTTTVPPPTSTSTTVAGTTVPATAATGPVGTPPAPSAGDADGPVRPAEQEAGAAGASRDGGGSSVVPALLAVAGAATLVAGGAAVHLSRAANAAADGDDESPPPTD